MAQPPELAQIFPPGLTIYPRKHAEYPETKRRLRPLLEVSGLLEHPLPIKPRAATEAEILRFHTPAHLELIRSLNSPRGVGAGELTPMGSGSFEIALLAAGGTMAAMDVVLTGKVRNAFALVRPPGPSCNARPCHGVLPVWQRGHCDHERAGCSWRGPCRNA